MALSDKVLTAHQETRTASQDGKLLAKLLGNKICCIIFFLVTPHEMVMELRRVDKCFLINKLKIN